MKIQKVLRGADRWSGVVESPAEVILRTCTTENIHCAELPGTGPSVGADRVGGREAMWRVIMSDQ